MGACVPCDSRAPLKMAAYYNEIDKHAAAWLRELIRRNCIAPGDVDERDIRDVCPDDLIGYTQCHFFAGIGVWSYALRRAGWADDRPVWTGSCPCQPFSICGLGGGFDDERHLWPYQHHLIAQRRPPVFFGEQVASRDGLAWLDLVQSDMEGTGYACGAVDLCAAGVGAPHIRQRLWIVADAIGVGSRTGLRDNQPSEQRGLQSSDRSQLGNTAGSGLEGRRAEHVQTTGGCNKGRGTTGPSPVSGSWRDADWIKCTDEKWRPIEPGTFPLADGAPARVVRLRGYGNAIVADAAVEVIKAYDAVRA